MARRSLRAAVSQPSSTTTTPQKRSAATDSISSARSKRSKPSTPSTIRVTPKKSQHFNGNKKKARKVATDDDEQSDAFEEPPTPSSASDDDDSGYEEANGYASATSDDDDVEADNSDTSEDTPRARQRKTPHKSAVTSSGGRQAKGQELWRPGVKTGLGPGTQVIIDKPKARPAGKTPYTDDTIHPNTMLFLGDLAENNDREWLKMHDPDYRTSLKDFNSFVECLQTKVCEFDPTIPELPLKDITFRIYRDVRFSKDQTPYKAHFSVAWSRTGRKGPFAAYYLQIKPGGNFVGGGLWHPEAQPVALLRRAIDRRSERLKAVLQDKGIQREFLAQKSKGSLKSDAAAIKAFVAHNQDNALKTRPKGYNADHPNIALLRLRNFTLGHRFEDSEVMGPKGLQRVAEVLSCLEPFITYLNSVVMPDDPEASESEAASDNEDDEAGSNDDD